MPAGTVNTQEQGFRSSLFGFDKNDVLAYMNTLADESRQREQEQQERVDSLERQLDGLRTQHSEARSHIEQLQTELAEANRRADEAEQKYRESALRADDEEKRAESYQTAQKESQKNANIWQLKCHDLQNQVDTLQKKLQEVPAPAPAPVEPTREARLEARKILADAKLYAESAERELKQQADAQKARMAENARGIAAGVMLLRDRLAQVDDSLASAALDLDHATESIYQALDQTEADLQELGTEMRDFSAGTPESDPPRTRPLPGRPDYRPAAASAPSDAPRPVRPKATARRMPRHRLRAARKPISRLLQDQIDRLALDDAEGTAPQQNQ